MTEEQDEVIEVPEPVQPPPPESEEEENAVEDLADIGRVTKEDILGKRDGNSEPDDMQDLTSLDEEDMEDLFGVDEELIPGTPPSTEPELPRRKALPMQRFQRTTKRYPPPTSLGGIR